MRTQSSFSAEAIANSKNGGGKEKSKTGRGPSLLASALGVNRGGKRERERGGKEIRPPHPTRCLTMKKKKKKTKGITVVKSPSIPPLRG